MTDDTITIGANAQAQLRTVIERVQRLEQERQDAQAGITEVLSEAKSNGFDPKIIRAVVKRLREDAAKRAAEEEMIDLYMHAVQGDLFGADA